MYNQTLFCVSDHNVLSQHMTHEGIHTAQMALIVRLQLNRIKKRVETNHQVPFQYTDAVVEQVVMRCNDAESGGRIIDAILTNTVLPRISLEYLNRMAEGKEIRRVALDVADNDFTYDFD